MNTKLLALSIAIFTFTVGVVVTRLSLIPTEIIPPTPNVDLSVSDYRLSGPYTHENLTIFLIHGPDTTNSKMFVPLQEAMQREFVIVHETKDVNELAIENVSRTEEVFVQAGDIVKGGEQDRVLAVDLILPARSGKIPISSFCVEQQRWQQRGAEYADHFSISGHMAASKSLKSAIKQANSQSVVWDNVVRVQGMLSRSVNQDVRSAISPSSLQLAIENTRVQDATKPYTMNLSPTIEGHRDVIGFILAINNQPNSAEAYSSNALFRRFWPKLLMTAAIEAVAERTNEKMSTISANKLAELIVDVERGTESTQEVTERTHMVRRESEKGLFLETRDNQQGGAWVHRSYLWN